jgi:hypothetical protein
MNSASLVLGATAGTQGEGRFPPVPRRIWTYQRPDGNCLIEAILDALSYTNPTP